MKGPSITDKAVEQLAPPISGGQPVTPVLLAWLETQRLLPGVRADLVAAIQTRDAFGRKKYGQPLLTGDGRDTITEIWQELLDALQYATKAEMEGVRLDVPILRTTLKILRHKMNPQRDRKSEVQEQEVQLRCAQAAHEINRIWCQAHGDDSQVQWAEAPEWQRQSAIQGVESALAGSTPEEQHLLWAAQKVKEGWIYGPKKDPVQKVHPCLVPYADLPPEQQAKDHLFIQIVKLMAEALK